MGCRDAAVGVNKQGVLIDLDSPYAWLGKLSDRRHARGVRYRLVMVLVLLVLAKLAGEDRVSGIAEWVQHRASLLTELLPKCRGKAPHRTTLSRILAWAVDVGEFEKTVQQSFASAPGAGRSIVVNLDGKTVGGPSQQGKAGCCTIAAMRRCVKTGAVFAWATPRGRWRSSTTWSSTCCSDKSTAMCPRRAVTMMPIQDKPYT